MAEASPVADVLAVGQVVGEKYKILGLLAMGGMGKIYRAEQMPLGRIVALKILHAKYTDDQDPEFQRRFLLEAETCAKLTHPNTVTVFDYGKIPDTAQGDVFFMAMELIEGKTLSQVLQTEGPLPVGRSLRIARQIGRSLREAHRLGIVHRDLKPSNVMLITTDEGESVKVLDFGLAKVLRDDSPELTREGRFIGSPRYMSPEQIRHLDIDHRSDIYALGVIVYQLLTGRVPFESEKAVQTLMMHINDPVPPMAAKAPASVVIPPAVEAIVLKCLAKEAKDRWANVDELLQAITRLGDGPGADAALRVSDPSWQSAPDPLSDSAPTVTDSSVSKLGSPGTVPIMQPAIARPADSRSKLMYAIAALLILGAAIGAVILAVQGGDDHDGPTARADHEPGEPQTVVLRQQDPTEAVARTTPEPASDLAPEPTRVRDPRHVDPYVPPPQEGPLTLTIHSTPSGAEVWEGGSRLGNTPLTVPLERDAARELQLRLEGYTPQTVRQPPSQRDVVMMVPLVRGTVRAVVRPRPPRERERDPEGPPRGQELEIKTTR